ncbi:hypothetical protein WMY93_000163 [Mugilogobius chulae]|uniref:SNTX MACPF/CDC-like domain-containing protein n=1 Tax=Mugilogobius chulae TaxID=88201 RepID=A0AAW0Q8B9_9GOBI
MEKALSPQEPSPWCGWLGQGLGWRSRCSWTVGSVRALAGGAGAVGRLARSGPWLEEQVQLEGWLGQGLGWRSRCSWTVDSVRALAGGAGGAGGLTLWDKKTLEENMRELPQPYTKTEIVASESVSEKASSLGVNAELKASFLSGLVEVGGSAKYLNDNKKTKNQARVALQYKTTTEFKTLTMEQLGTKNIEYKEVFDKGLATHVATGILYGADAFFVFDQDISEDEDVNEIEGSLKVVIEKFPSISIKGKGK